MVIRRYTPEMFYEDDSAINNILRFSTLLKLPQNEMPSINIKGLVLQLNTNTIDADIAKYFTNKYPKPECGIYFIIYMDIIDFLHSNKEVLIKNDLIHITNTSVVEIDTSLFEVILSSIEYNKYSTNINNNELKNIIQEFTKLGLVKPIGYSQNNAFALPDLYTPQIIPTSKLITNNKFNFQLVLKSVKSYIKAQNKRDSHAKRR